jgi:hypothetical protein
MARHAPELVAGMDRNTQRAKLRFRANHPRARSATRPADVNYISRIIVISLEVNDARSG